jgi:hypothetical protein
VAPVADEEAHLAVEDKPELVLLLVQMVRRRVADRSGELHQAQRVPGRGAGQRDPGLATEEPQRLALGARFEGGEEHGHPRSLT